MGRIQGHNQLPQIQSASKAIGLTASMCLSRRSTSCRAASSKVLAGLKSVEQNNVYERSGELRAPPQNLFSKTLRVSVSRVTFLTSESI